MTELAAVLAGLGGAALILARSRPQLLAALAVACISLAWLALDLLGGDFSGLGAAAAAAATLLAGLAVVGGGALFVRFPMAVLPALLLAAPLRLPIAADSSSALLFRFVESGGLGRLYPFYAVLIPAVAALAWTTWRESDTGVRLYAPVAVPLAALVALAGASALWSPDVAATADQLVFFWLPFTLTFAVVARGRGAGTGGSLAIVLVATAALFAAIGIWQAATEQLFFYTSALAEVNAHGPLFRVTSVFQDPSHFGRWLVIGIGIVFVALWTGRIRLVHGVVLSLLMLAGLVFSYSQSSIVAMVVVLLALAVAVGDRVGRRVALTIAVTAVVVGGAALVVAATRADDFERFTRERSRLALDTAAVAIGHPFGGVGLGAQAQVTREEQNPTQDEPHNASHTTPLTVAAELGLLGLAAYLALLAGAARALLVIRRVDVPLALGLGTVLLALLVHSLLYAGFFDNPVVWGALGLAGGVAGRAASGRDPEVTP